MRYQVTHRTRYTYDFPAIMCHNQVYQKPMSSDGQQLIQFRYQIDPEPDFLSFRKDIFENDVLFFSVLKSHKALLVEVVSEVSLSAPGYMGLDFSKSMPWEEVVGWLHTIHAPSEIKQFYLESHHVRFIDGAKDYAQVSFTPNRPVLEAVRDLTSRIFKDFTFSPLFTDISTPLEQVFASKKGVCQDFAHFQLACLRSMGLAACYVSGYIETLPPPGKPKLVGADASHAWIAVYVPQVGWVAFDPTNNLVVSDQHIRAAIGRDFANIVPLKGVIYSGGSQQMHVSVDVRKLEV